MYKYIYNIINRCLTYIMCYQEFKELPNHVLKLTYTSNIRPFNINNKTIDI